MKTMKFRLLVVLLVTVLVSTSIPASAFVSNHGQTVDAAASVITADETKVQTVTSSAEPESSDDNSELIETTNALAGTVKAYFEDSNWYSYIAENSDMKLKYTVSKDYPQYVNYIQNSQGGSYIENTMDVFVRMTDGQTVYASTSSENAIANMFRHGYYYDEVRFEGQNFAEEVQGNAETSLDIFSQTSKHNVSVSTNYSNGSWWSGGTKSSITVKVSEDSDPYVEFSKSLSIDTSTYNYAYITMLTSLVTSGSVYVKFDNGDYKSIGFNVFADGVEHTYKIDLTKIRGYSEGAKITAFRIDLDKYTDNGSVEIKSIKFVNGVEGGIKNLYLANIFHVYSDKLHYEMQLAASEAVNDIEEIGVKTEIPTANVAKIIVADKNGTYRADANGAQATLSGVDWDSATYVGFDINNVGVFGIILPVDETTGKLKVTVENGKYVIIYSRTPSLNQIRPGSGSGADGVAGVGNENDFYMGYRIHTDETHTFDELELQAYFERNPLTERQIVIDYANSDNATFVGYDGVRGSYMFDLDYQIDKMYDNFRNKHFALNFTVKSKDHKRLAYFVVGTDVSLLECSAILDNNLMMLPVPIEVGKNFCGDKDENIFDKLDTGYSEAILPIIADPTVEREYTVLHLYENWGDFQLKQISFIEFTNAYYHLSTGTVESNCLVPWGWPNNRNIPGYMPDHRGMSGTEWPGTRTHQAAGNHSFFRYSGSYYEELTNQDIDSYGPTYVDYTSEYLTDDGKIKTTRRHLEYSDLDENRTYYMFEYEALESVTLSKTELQFYSVGTNDTDDPYQQFGYLNSSNVSQTNTFANIGEGKTQYYTLGSNKPYFSIFQRNSVNYANVALLVDSCTITRSTGSQDVTLAIRCSDGRVALTIAESSLTLSAGDKINLNVILLPWGSEESDYSGTTYAPDQNVRDVRENTLLNPVRISILNNCTVTENYFMYKLETTNGKSAEFSISGGQKNTTTIPYREGYHTVPVRIYGFNTLSVPIVYEKINGDWVKHDISSADNLDTLGYGAYYDGYNVYYDEDGTYSYSFMIDVTNATTREFKVELDENFTGFEKIEGKDTAFLYEKPMNVFLDYQEFGDAIWKEWFGRVTTNYEEDGSGYLSLYPLPSGSESTIGGLVVNSENNVTGQYVVLKYRIPEGQPNNSDMLFQFFLSTKYTDISDPRDKIEFSTNNSTLKADGNWHVMIVDLASYTSKSSFAADDDGQRRVKYVRFDPFNGIADTNKEYENHVDVAYFAIHDDLAEILEYCDESILDYNSPIANFTLISDAAAYTFTKSTQNYVAETAESDGSFNLTVSRPDNSQVVLEKKVLIPATNYRDYGIGDVNHDDAITTLDLLEMFLYIFNSEGLDSKYLADINRDGDVTNEDILLISKYLFSPTANPIK